MKKLKLIAALGLASSLFAGASMAEDALSAGQKAEVKAVIAEYLKENPKVVIDAIQAWQAHEAELEAQQRAEAVKELQQEAAHTTSPVWGNPKGDVTVIEFFDYNCPYCKRAFPSVKNLVAEDGNIRIVMKEFPVLGEASVYAAKAALAAQKQGKYVEFHDAMMSNSGRLSPEGVDATAKQVGMDVARMKEDMKSPDVSQELQEVQVWAQRLGVNGTPAFVIGERLVPGAIDGSRMQALVKKARQAK